jgi:hypothetical protein
MITSSGSMFVWVPFSEYQKFIPIGACILVFGIILGGRACPHLKLHAVGTVNILNVEHRTPNIER